MNLKQALKSAEDIGFTVERRDWVADDYTLVEGDDGVERERWKKVKCWCYKLTYPADYPHPPSYVDSVNGVMFAIKEYDDREKHAEEAAKKSQQTIEAVARVGKMLKELEGR